MYVVCGRSENRLWIGEAVVKEMMKAVEAMGRKMVGVPDFAKTMKALPRVLMAKKDGRYYLLVEPLAVPVTSTTPVMWDEERGMWFVYCPYLDRLYSAFGLEPDYDGRLELKPAEMDGCVMAYEML